MDKNNKIKGILSGLNEDIEEEEQVGQELLNEIKDKLLNNNQVRKRPQTFSMRSDIINKLEEIKFKSEGLTKSEIVEIGIEIIYEYINK